MDHFHQSRQALLQFSHQLSDLIKDAESAAGRQDPVFSQWKQVCGNIERHVMDHIVRIAVVGAIKSGKSTLVNSMLKADYLKRGAGVVTSIVTRLRQGRRLKARLYFKSWDEINTEIQQALVLFPSDEWRAANVGFDIRRSKDRANLAQALDSLDAALRINQDRLNPNGILLSSYLKGFQNIESFVGAENTIKEFDALEFPEHRAFVAHDARAVYLKDIELEIPGDVLSSNIEIADCQGSDSPNPMHMAMIQDYLLKAHLIIYVISSRTGLRQADIRFLATIKRMGIDGNMLFVCNCDLSEHDNLEDLLALKDRIEEELALIIHNPKLFTFSALLNLLVASESDLSQKDANKLMQWRKSTRMASFSEEQSLQLGRTLDRKLTRDRSLLLLQNQLERLNLLNSGLFQWIKLHRDFLHRDTHEAKNMAKRLDQHHNHILQVQTTIQSTLEGAVQKIKKDLRNEVDRFFDRHDGSVLQGTIYFLQHYAADLSQYREQLSASGFTNTLYTVFQDFKHALDTYMTQSVNPEIIGFMGKQERRLIEDFLKVAEPYAAMVKEAIGRYEEMLAHLGLPLLPERGGSLSVPDLESMKQSTGISLPPAAASMRYSAHIKTEAVMHLGFYSLVRLVRRALKKAPAIDARDELKALQIGIRRMKRETERSIIAHFKDYRENVKFQYVFRLADAIKARMIEALIDHFHAYTADLGNLIESIGSEKSDREQVDAVLNDIEAGSVTLQKSMAQLRLEILDQKGHASV
jgi:GTPase SAR1 family protein